MFVFTSILVVSSLSTVSFGNVRVKRVLGGSPVRSGEYPYFALIRIANSRHCGGAMVAREWIVTTASCVGETEPTRHVPRKLLMDISVGIDDIDGFESKMLEPPFIHFPHPEYSDRGTKNIYNNILLIKLNKRKNWPGMGVVNLPEKGEEEKYIEEDNGVIALGMGDDEYLRPSRVLKAAKMKIFENKKCWKNITSDYFCAGTDDGLHDMCDEDYGGPLVAADKPTLLGIHSVRIVHRYANVTEKRLCGGRTLHGQYTRVSLYLEWIETMMKTVE